MYGTNVSISFTAKRSFYTYIFVLCLLNAVQSLGSGLLLYEMYAGLCIVDVTTYVYFTLLTPLVYYAFLSEFFGCVYSECPGVFVVLLRTMPSRYMKIMFCFQCVTTKYHVLLQSPSWWSNGGWYCLTTTSAELLITQNWLRLYLPGKNRGNILDLFFQ